MLRSNPPKIPSRSSQASIASLAGSSDFSSLDAMPACAEKSLCKLLQRLAATTTLLVDTSNLEQELKNLRDQLVDEEEIDGGSSSSSAITSLCDQALAKIRVREWSAARRVLERLLREQLRPFDFNETFRLIEKHNERSNSSAIKNQEIFLFLGFSGSGKSTLVHFLASSRIIKAQHQYQRAGANFTTSLLLNSANNNNELSQNDEEEDDDYTIAESHARHIDSPGTHTRFVQAIRIETVNSSLVLCDTPGLDETSSVEAELANNYAIFKAIQQCASVRPIVLLDYNRLVTTCSFQAYARVLSNMLRSGDEINVSEFSNSFGFLFVKCSARRVQHIVGKLLAEQLSEEERGDSQLALVFDDMMNKLRHHYQQMHVSLLRDKPEQVIENLSSTSDSITNPSEVFQLYVSERVRAAVQRQLMMHQRCIEWASARGNCALIKYKLDQLKRLSTEVLPYVKYTYEKCLSNIRRITLSKYESATQALNACLETSATLNKSDVRAYKTTMEDAGKYACLQGTHFLDFDVVAEGSASGCMVSVESYLQILKSYLERATQELGKIDCMQQQPLARSLLEKLKLITESFALDASYYERAKDIVARKMNASYEQFRNEVNTNGDDFERFATLLTNVFDTYFNFEHHFDQKRLAAEYSTLRKFLLANLEAEVIKVEKQLQQQRPLSVKDISHSLKRLESALSTAVLYSHIKRENISAILESTLNKVDRYFAQLEEQISAKEQPQQQLEMACELVKEMEALRAASPMVESRTARIYYKTMERLCSVVRDSTQKIEQFLASSNKSQTISKNKQKFQQQQQEDMYSINYEQLFDSMATVNRAEWLNKYEPDIYQPDLISGDVVNKLTKHVKKMSQVVLAERFDMKTMKSDSDNTEAERKIAKMRRALVSLNELKQCLDDHSSVLNTSIDTLRYMYDAIQNANRHFAYSCNQVLQVVNAQLDQWRSSVTGMFNLDERSGEVKKLLSYDFERYELYLKYLNALNYNDDEDEDDVTAINNNNDDSSLPSSPTLKMGEFQGEFKPPKLQTQQSQHRLKKSQQDLLISNTLKQFKQFIAAYVTFVERELDESFKVFSSQAALMSGTLSSSASLTNLAVAAASLDSSLSSNSDSASGSGVAVDSRSYFYYARTLVCFLSQLSDLSDNAKYPNLSQLVPPNIYASWQNTLDEYALELNEEILYLQECNSVNELNDRMARARVLKNLDRFIKTTDPTRRFEYVYNTVKDSMTRLSSDISQTIADAIDKLELTEFLVNQIRQLESQNKLLFGKVKTRLNARVQGLIDAIQTKAKTISGYGGAGVSGSLLSNQFEQLASDLERLRRCQVARDLIDGGSDFLERTLRNLDDLVSEQVFLYTETAIKHPLDNGNFREAHYALLGLKMDHHFRTSFLLTNDKLRKRIEFLEKYERDKVQEAVQFHVNTNEDYAVHQPRELWRKFDSITDEPAYTDAKQALVTGLIAKFERRFKGFETASQQDDSNLSKQLEEELLPRLEQALPFMPDNVQQRLRLLIEQSRKTLTATSLQQKKRFQELFENDEPEAIFQAYKKHENRDKQDEMRDFVLKRVLELKQRCEQAIRDGHIANDEFRYDLLKLFAYESTFIDDITRVRQPCEHVRKSLATHLISRCSSVKTQFRNDPGSVTANTFNEVVLALVGIRDELNAADHSTQFLNEPMREFSEFSMAIVDYLRSNQQSIEKALDKFDFKQFLAHLNIIQICSATLTKLIEYYTRERDQAKLQELREIKSVKQITHDMLNPKLDELEACFGTLNLSNKQNQATVFEKAREDFYQKLRGNLALVKEAKVTLGGKLAGVDLNLFETRCMNQLRGECIKVSSAAQNSARYILANTVDYNDQSLKSEFQTLNAFLLELSNMGKYLADMLAEANQEQILLKIEQSILHSFNTNVTGSLEDTVSLLIRMKFFAQNLPFLKKKIDAAIDAVLAKYKKDNLHLGSAAVANLGKLLNIDQSVGGMGQLIVSEHASFKGFSLSLFNLRTQRHDIEYVLRNITGDGIDNTKKEQLRRRFVEFDQKYQTLITTYIKSSHNADKYKKSIEDLVNKTRHIASQLRTTVLDSNDVKSVIPDMMAHIFALWSLLNAEHYFDAKDLADRDNYLFLPHAAQVVSIFRMLGVTDSRLNNNLIQIGTGEGKSVILAVTSSILALLGNEVNCACYSSYLSTRDHSAFKKLFDALSVSELIRYGTFNKLCEDFINEKGDIRKRVEDLILTGKTSLSTTTSPRLPSRGLGGGGGSAKQRPKIILIDEVDVFFSKDFYGSIFSPSSTFKCTQIDALIDRIWREQKNSSASAPLNMSTIDKWPEYAACCAYFREWQFLVREAVKDMVCDLKATLSQTTRDYEVIDDRIGYKFQDDLEFNVVYRYKTLFSYYYEHEQGKITSNSLAANKRIQVKLGQFSYAEIPKQFTYIMGVTGTLKTLSEPEKRVIQDVYNIRKNTFTPSVFGENKLSFEAANDLKIVNKDDYYNALKDEIEKKLGYTDRLRRAVLVFFESKKHLMEFYDFFTKSSAIQVNILTEDANKTEREILVQKATNSGQVTFLTRVFGRGTDFVCNDQIVRTNGGVHVIQTFFSQELSEEVQIKGRTARQGDSGSYSMILLESSLEKFCQNQSDPNERGLDYLKRRLNLSGGKKSYYDILNENRMLLFDELYKDTRQNVDSLLPIHNKSVNFLDSLETNNLSFIKQFLLEQNEGIDLAQQGMSELSRTIVLMDATGSMSHLLQKAKNTVTEMFRRIADILVSNQIDKSCFQIQFVVYRNYNSKEHMLLECSPWEQKPDNLFTFIGSVEVDGGWGNEAIEVALWHANEEHAREKISQVILIGDAPPNYPREEVFAKRDYLGTAYWRQTRFAKPTFYEDEIERLARAKVPVHAFYVAEIAHARFEEIAKKTAGKCQYLDIHSPQGANMLTDLVSEGILENIGKLAGKGDKLIADYRQKYPKSYT